MQLADNKNIERHLSSQAIFTSHMLEVRNLNQFYGTSQTLRDISFSVNKGDCLVIMGRNGVGKTTLVDAIMGLHEKIDGSIVFKGKEIIATQASSRAELKIGYVPQGRRIFPLLSVLENLKIGLPYSDFKCADSKYADSNTIPEFIFELFPVLKSMLSRLGGDLSGGQQQQLAIARALVINPELLILDEPTEGIQPNIIKDICAIINQLNEQYGVTVLLVEQKLPIARSIADTFMILDRGQLVADGQMNELDETTIKRYLTV